MGTEEAAVLCKQIESSGRLAQEKLSHHLDVVEISIAEQVAQKSHHFFQVRKYSKLRWSVYLALPNIGCRTVAILSTKATYSKNIG